MGQLFVPADDSYTPIPFNTIADISELATYSPMVIQGVWGPDNNDPTTVWSGTGGSLGTKLFLGTQFHRVHYQKLQGGISGDVDMLSTLNYIMLYAFRIDDGEPEHPKYNYVIWMQSETSDPTTANRNMSRGDWLDWNILYQSTGDAPSFLEEERDWDESPSTNPDDPTGIDPLGGEFADTDYFNETVLQYLADLDEPETIDYGTFLTAYSLDYTNIPSLGSAIFDTSFWTSLKNKFEGLSDPMSFIISAVEIPFRLGVTPTSFKLGGIAVTDPVSGGQIPCLKHTSRYFKYSFGTITLKEVWGTSKDYTDCDISIFLPYVGMRQIDPDLAVNSQLTLAVIVDVWTGDLNYMLQINNSNMVSKYFNSSGVPYRWSGNCGNRIPIGKVDPSTPILNVASSLGSMAIGAGMMIAGGAVGGPAGAAAGAAAGSAMMGGAGASTFMSGAKSLAGDFNSGFSPLAQSSGNISGGPGYMDYQYPYLVIKRGVPKYPNNWRTEFGAPRYQEFTISDLSGYTEFADIHADDVSGASDDEKRMIEDILKDGIII